MSALSRRAFQQVCRPRADLRAQQLPVSGAVPYLSQLRYPFSTGSVISVAGTLHSNADWWAEITALFTMHVAGEWSHYVHGSASRVSAISLWSALLTYMIWYSPIFRVWYCHLIKSQSKHCFAVIMVAKNVTVYGSNRWGWIPRKSCGRCGRSTSYPASVTRGKVNRSMKLIALSFSNDEERKKSRVWHICNR